MSNVNSHLADRKYFIGGFFILVVIIYIVRLFYIQLIDDQYKIGADKNALRRTTEYAVRGYIFDRKGKILVYNEPSYDLMIVPRETKGCDTLGLCAILEITKEEYLKRIKKACQHPNSARKESIFEKQLSKETYAILQEKLFRFKGFFFQKRAIRKYPKPIAAHLMGYVGEVSKEKAKKDRESVKYFADAEYMDAIK